MRDDSVEIHDILSLSYNDLPTELKQCFLYFGIFPEDRDIPAEDIVWMWMAEGFIPRGEERMEDVGVDFLNELIRRNLIQAAYMLLEEVTVCRIHDLVRDLAIQKALEVNLLGIYDPKNHSISSLCIRHAIHGQAQRYLSLDFSNLKLRSVLFFHEENEKLDKLKFHKKFQNLYVLHLENWSGTLPTAIGSLYHLKYIKVRGDCKIPSSIGNLKNLQTLSAGGVGQLPPQIANLTNLRHLAVVYEEPLQHISKLTSLQVLRSVGCDQWKYVDPVELVNLQELRMLSIKKSYSLINISSLKNLSILTLLSDESLPDLEFLSSCKNLQKLYLKGRIEKLPLCFPDTITMMILSDSILKEDPMPILGRLPNLRDLQLRTWAYEGKEIRCNDNSFPQLEFLRLSNLYNLERWDLGTSAMPLFKALGIHRCPKLNEIPERMKDVPSINFHR